MYLFCVHFLCLFFVSDDIIIPKQDANKNAHKINNIGNNI